MNTLDVDNEKFVDIVERFSPGFINGEAVIKVSDLRAFINSFDSVTIRNKDYEMRQVALNSRESAKLEKDLDQFNPIRMKEVRGMP